MLAFVFFNEGINIAGASGLRSESSDLKRDDLHWRILAKIADLLFPIMSNHKRRLKELEDRSAALDSEYMARRYETEDEADEAAHIHYAEVGQLENEINAIRSQMLAQKAARFGLDLIAEIGPWNTHPVKPIAWLEETEQAKAKRLISQAQFEWWKKRVDLLTPILSTLVGILGLLVALVALFRN